MRWLAALLASGLLAAALYFLAVRDRTFQSYSGAEVGMEVETALSRLGSSGYIMVFGSSASMDHQCSHMDRYLLVRGVDPTYSLTISADSTCKVSEIKRTLRGGEL
ncbi:hypothetical protein ACFQRC_04915 [Enterovirga sp. GCM10030262]|uniref:hypothetical protein n=1 Tax=Enterovirga sp. GCM10030262 TaxID=3273391 RepID=UPI0036133DFD